VLSPGFQRGGENIAGVVLLANVADREGSMRGPSNGTRAAIWLTGRVGKDVISYYLPYL
jgi:hypothetical protein